MATSQVLHDGRPSAAPSVFIVDDHELFSVTLQMALSSMGIDAGSASSCALDQVLREVADLNPGLVVLDLDLGRAGDGSPLRGEEMVTALRAAGWRVLVLSGRMSPEHPGTAAAIAAGAIGAVHKSESFERLLDVILLAARGAQVMTDSEYSGWMARADSHRRDHQHRVERLNRLSPREREVLDRLVRGHRAAEIAREFTVSLTTVRTQIRSMLAKLELTSQLSAVALASKVEQWEPPRDGCSES